MNQSADIGAIAAALVAVQKRIEPVVKDSTNPHFKNRYASLDSITEYVRPLLAEHGIAVIQGGGDLTNGGLMVVTTLLHESGQWISSSYEMPLEKATPQAAGSAITYGRRYGLASFLALTTEEDDDGNSASKPKQRSKPADKPADAPPITRESEITFGSMKGKKISDMKDAFLQWGLEDGRHFGPRTKEWQDAFRSELAHRDGATNG